MAKKSNEKAPEEKPEAENGGGIKAVTRKDVTDLAAEADKVADPYKRKPKIKKGTEKNGITAKTRL